MNPIFILGLIVVYFITLFGISYYTSGKGDNDTFFSANRNSRWYLVAFGMIGTSLSGVTFISVPGQVATHAFSYMQVVLGYMVGYMVIATVLMPLYYRLNLISIYTYLESRFGPAAYQTGAWIFLVSRSLGSAARFYLVLGVLQLIVFGPLGVPFWLSVIIGLMLIWLYTYQGGVKTIIITDTLQTACMLACLVSSLYLISDSLGFALPELLGQIWQNPLSKIIHTDWHTADYFWKQFVAGAFIAIVMTGLDQDMMQKNLTCRSLKEAQTNMFSFMGVLLLVNLLFLVLGAALVIFAQNKGIALPAKADDLFPMIANNHLPLVAGVVFILGIIAATYASTDSALTALTTSFCVDILGMTRRQVPNADALRKRVHLGFTGVLFVLVLAFKQANSPSLLTVVFTLAGYTYGPLLGLFSFGILTKRRVADRAIPVIALLSPAITFGLDYATKQVEGGYRFGFELLLVNGGITFLGLLLCSRKEDIDPLTV